MIKYKEVLLCLFLDIQIQTKQQDEIDKPQLESKVWAPILAFAAFTLPGFIQAGVGSWGD